MVPNETPIHLSQQPSENVILTLFHRWKIRRSSKLVIHPRSYQLGDGGAGLTTQAVLAPESFVLTTALNCLYFLIKRIGLIKYNPLACLSHFSNSKPPLTFRAYLIFTITLGVDIINPIYGARAKTSYKGHVSQGTQPAEGRFRTWTQYCSFPVPLLYSLSFLTSFSFNIVRYSPLCFSKEVPVFHQNSLRVIPTPTLHCLQTTAGGAVDQLTGTVLLRETLLKETATSLPLFFLICLY